MVNYLPEYQSALNPAPGALATNLLKELREHLGEKADDAELLERCRAATRRIDESWSSQKIDPKDAQRVERFYAENNLYCYELVGLEIDFSEDRQKLLLDLMGILKKRGATKGIDIGSGVGTWGILLNRNGMSCDFGDISPPNLEFVAKRLAKRGIQGARTFDLRTQEPERAQYDFVTAFDVLEHAADPVPLLKKMIGYLKPGGVLLFNLVCADHDESLHLLKNPNVIRKVIRGFGTRKIDQLSEFKIYERVARPAWMDTAIGAFDSAFWEARTFIRGGRP